MLNAGTSGSLPPMGNNNEVLLKNTTNKAKLMKDANMVDDPKELETSTDSETQDELGGRQSGSANV